MFEPLDLERFSTLMRWYALCGLEDWRKTSDFTRAKIREQLGLSTVVSNKGELDQALSTPWNHDELDRHKVIPMPYCNQKYGANWFFLPIRQAVYEFSFEAIVLIQNKHVLAFRFELAHSGSPHDYGHVQFMRTIRKGETTAGIEPWIPDSYPAFPIGASDPLELFLAMAVSVHGNTGAFVDLLLEMCRQNSRSGEFFYYQEKLKVILGA